MPQPISGNLFDRLPAAGGAEQTEPVVRGSGFQIERIVSRGQVSAPGHWYDQSQDEWVVVLEGSARVEIEQPPRTLALGRGDWIHLPARCRHRVSWTDPERDTIWLAVHGLPRP